MSQENGFTEATELVLQSVSLAPKARTATRQVFENPARMANGPLTVLPYWKTVYMTVQLARSAPPL